MGYCFLNGPILSLNKLHAFDNSENSAFPTFTVLLQFALCKNSRYLHFSHSLSHSPFLGKVSNFFLNSSSLHKSTLIFTIFSRLSVSVLQRVGWGILESCKSFWKSTFINPKFLYRLPCFCSFYLYLLFLP